MRTSRSIRWFFLLVAAGFLTACGEEPEDTSGAALPDRPEDKLIQGTGPPEQVDRDPTPQAGTSGTIPGYTSLDNEEDDGGAEPSPSD